METLAKRAALIHTKLVFWDNAVLKALTEDHPKLRPHRHDLYHDRVSKHLNPHFSSGLHQNRDRDTLRIGRTIKLSKRQNDEAMSEMLKLVARVGVSGANAHTLEDERLDVARCCLLLLQLETWLDIVGGNEHFVVPSLHQHVTSLGSQSGSTDRALIEQALKVIQIRFPTASECMPELLSRIESDIDALIENLSWCCGIDRRLLNVDAGYTKLIDICCSIRVRKAVSSEREAFLAAFDQSATSLKHLMAKCLNGYQTFLQWNSPTYSVIFSRMDAVCHAARVAALSVKVHHSLTLDAVALTVKLVYEHFKKEIPESLIVMVSPIVPNAILGLDVGHAYSSTILSTSAISTRPSSGAAASKRSASSAAAASSSDRPASAAATTTFGSKFHHQQEQETTKLGYFWESIEGQESRAWAKRSKRSGAAGRYASILMIQRGWRKYLACRDAVKECANRAMLKTQKQAAILLCQWWKRECRRIELKQVKMHESALRRRWVREQLLEGGWELPTIQKQKMQYYHLLSHQQENILRLQQQQQQSQNDSNFSYLFSHDGDQQQQQHDDEKSQEEVETEEKVESFVIEGEEEQEEVEESEETTEEAQEKEQQQKSQEELQIEQQKQEQEQLFQLHQILQQHELEQDQIQFQLEQQFLEKQQELQQLQQQQQQQQNQKTTTAADNIISPINFASADFVPPVVSGAVWRRQQLQQKQKQILAETIIVRKEETRRRGKYNMKRKIHQDQESTSFFDNTIDNDEEEYDEQEEDQEQKYFDNQQQQQQENLSLTSPLDTQNQNNNNNNSLLDISTVSSTPSMLGILYPSRVSSPTRINRESLMFCSARRIQRFFFFVLYLKKKERKEQQEQEQQESAYTTTHDHVGGINNNLPLGPSAQTKGTKVKREKSRPRSSSSLILEKFRKIRREQQQLGEDYKWQGDWKSNASSCGGSDGASRSSSVDNKTGEREREGEGEGSKSRSRASSLASNYEENNQAQEENNNLLVFSAFCDKENQQKQQSSSQLEVSPQVSKLSTPMLLLLHQQQQQQKRQQKIIADNDNLVCDDVTQHFQENLASIPKVFSISKQGQVLQVTTKNNNNNGEQQEIDNNDDENDNEKEQEIEKLDTAQQKFVEDVGKFENHRTDEVVLASMRGSASKLLLSACSTYLLGKHLVELPSGFTSLQDRPHWIEDDVRHVAAHLHDRKTSSSRSSSSRRKRKKKNKRFNENENSVIGAVLSSDDEGPTSPIRNNSSSSNNKKLQLPFFHHQRRTEQLLSPIKQVISGSTKTTTTNDDEQQQQQQQQAEDSSLILSSSYLSLQQHDDDHDEYSLSSKPTTQASAALLQYRIAHNTLRHPYQNWSNATQILRVFCQRGLKLLISELRQIDLRGMFQFEDIEEEQQDEGKESASASSGGKFSSSAIAKERQRVQALDSTLQLICEAAGCNSLNDAIAILSSDISKLVQDEDRPIVSILRTTLNLESRRLIIPWIIIRGAAFEFSELDPELLKHRRERELRQQEKNEKRKRQAARTLERKLRIEEEMEKRIRRAEEKQKLMEEKAAARIIEKEKMKEQKRKDKEEVKKWQHEQKEKEKEKKTEKKKEKEGEKQNKSSSPTTRSSSASSSTSSTSTISSVSSIGSSNSSTANRQLSLTDMKLQDSGREDNSSRRSSIGTSKASSRSVSSSMKSSSSESDDDENDFFGGSGGGVSSPNSSLASSQIDIDARSDEGFNDDNNNIDDDDESFLRKKQQQQQQMLRKRKNDDDGLNFYDSTSVERRRRNIFRREQEEEEENDEKEEDEDEDEEESSFLFVPDVTEGGPELSDYDSARRRLSHFMNVALFAISEFDLGSSVSASGEKKHNSYSTTITTKKEQEEKTKQNFEELYQLIRSPHSLIRRWLNLPATLCISLKKIKRRCDLTLMAALMLPFLKNLQGWFESSFVMSDEQQQQQQEQEEEEEEQEEYEEQQQDEDELDEENRERYRQYQQYQRENNNRDDGDDEEEEEEENVEYQMERIRQIQEAELLREEEFVKRRDMVQQMYHVGGAEHAESDDDMPPSDSEHSPEMMKHLLNVPEQQQNNSSGEATSHSNSSSKVLPPPYVEKK